MNFNEFSLHGDLLKGIEAAGYVTCTPVQEQVLKTSLDGDDLYVQSQTGTGKTAAYLVSIIQELLSHPEADGKKALVLVPTRELAVQVEDEAKRLLQSTALKAFSFYGGVGYEKQVAAIKNGVSFIIGTPGRIIDLKKGGQLDLGNVAYLVIDEADRMFDMGFYPDLRMILKFLPASEQRQTMLFSATLNTYVKNLAWEYTRDAKEITIEAESVTVDEIDQELIHVSSDEKTRLLLGILGRDKPESVIIFCNTKRGCEVIAKRLRINGFESEFIIGDMQQSKRLKVLEDFKASKVSILVATDVAARGIDVNDLAMVVNYDLPNEPENYVHRIGRTARAGKSGRAYTFCSEKDVYDLPAIERYIGKQIPSSVCSEDMLAEDKSNGIYIKLDSYGSRDDDSRQHYGKDHDSRRERKSRNGDRPQRGRKPASQRPDKAPRKEAEEDLSGLTFEERMEVYKKKYANTASSPASGNRKGNNRNGGRNRTQQGGKKDYSVRGQRGNNAKSAVRQHEKPVAAKSTIEKKGLIARIKAFFSKKK